MNLSPIVYVRGDVRRVTLRHVDAFEGRPASVDPETGERKSMLPAREAYDVADVVILTTEGGFAEVGFNMAEHAGLIPQNGETVEIPCRIFAGWKSSGRGKSYNVVRLIAEPRTASTAAKAS
jgi:hypothetical protein